MSSRFLSHFLSCVVLAVIFPCSLSAYSVLPNAGTACATSGTPRTVVICAPKSQSTNNSPIHISAAIRGGAAAVAHVDVYVDGVKKYGTGLNGLGQADNGD